MSIESKIKSDIKLEPALHSAMRKVKVWDVPTRIFHWSIVALVAIAWATGEEEGTAFIVHSVAGYALLTALIFRLVWGFIGGFYARFSNFVRPWSAVARYAKQLAQLKPQHIIGHNPLGGWMIVLLLAVLALIVVSGLFAQGEEGLAGPWAASAVVLTAQQWYELHEVSFNVLLVLIIVHIAGVVIDQFLTGDKLVQAMFTGVKRIGADEEVLERQSVGWAKALAVLVAAFIATGFIVGWQLPSASPQDGQAVASQQEHRESEEAHK
jgi:cytochrome b